jgi:hypothetical protein
MEYTHLLKIDYDSKSYTIDVKFDMTEAKVYYKLRGAPTLEVEESCSINRLLNSFLEMYRRENGLKIVTLTKNT